MKNLKHTKGRKTKSTVVNISNFLIDSRGAKKVYPLAVLEFYASGLDKTILSLPGSEIVAVATHQCVKGSE